MQWPPTRPGRNGKKFHFVDAAEATHEYGLKLTPLEEFVGLDALILAVKHKWYLELGLPRLLGMIRDNGVMADIKSVLDPSQMKRGIRYWSL
jgi:UDP-N-acetyl-D-galactosamine dehydrogenase